MSVLASDVDRKPAYTVAHRWLHWLVAIGVAGLFVTALSLESSEGAIRDRYYVLHWSLGFTVAVLMVLRVISRVVAPPAPLRVPMSAAQKGVAHATHLLLYLLLLANPVLGYVGKSLYGGAITIFWLFDLPTFLPIDQDLAEDVLAVHGFVGYAIFALVAVHVLGAMYHLFRGDETLSRITTG